MPNPVIHFEIQSADADKSCKFFADVFGWNIQGVPDMPMPYNLVDTESESGINGGIGPSLDGESHTAFYIEVDDIQGYLDKAVEHGGQVIIPVTTIPGAVTMAFFSDPAGANVGLVASETPPAAQ